VLQISGGTECLVDRVCDNGARIHLADTSEIPLEFYINVEGEQAPRYCAVARRGVRRVSVYFV
jgi:hypothetical protein